jgi:hypothetical protein
MRHNEPKQDATQKRGVYTTHATMYGSTQDDNTYVSLAPDNGTSGPGHCTSYSLANMESRPTTPAGHV